MTARRLLAAILNRVATAEMRHAALLLGYEVAGGYGRQGWLLGSLREFATGAELGLRSRRARTGLQMLDACEMWALERHLYRPAPASSAGGAR